MERTATKADTAPASPPHVPMHERAHAKRTGFAAYTAPTTYRYTPVYGFVGVLPPAATTITAPASPPHTRM